MNWFKLHVYCAGRNILLAGVFFFVALLAGATEKDERFEVLQIGTQTYSNVTITTKSKSSVFFTHSGGMANVKTSELPPQVKEQLGYVDEQPKVRTNSPAVWAKKTLARMETTKVKEVERQVEEKWRTYFPDGLATMPPIDRATLGMIIGGLLLLHLCFSYCYMSICKKAGTQPGVMVWLPILQIFPLLRAAKMSYGWFLMLLVPLLNLLVPIIWSFKIAKARGKSAWLGFLLILPGIGLFAFLYLAFSDGAGRRDRGPMRVMSLETA
jgi:hypothetical protein